MTASAKGRASRRKGISGELEAIKILQANGWPIAERTQRGVAQERGDVANGPRGTYIEIRRREKLSVPASVREVIAAAQPGELPLLVHRPSRCPWMVTLRLEDLLPHLLNDELTKDLLDE